MTMAKPERLAPETRPFWALLFLTLFAFGCYKLIFLLIFVLVGNYYMFYYEQKLPKNNFKVCIVGAGFSGIAMGIKMKKLGIDYEIFEALDKVGGAWAANVYPGCQSDVPSHLYCYSFAQNPFWSQRFPLQNELQEYMEWVVCENDLNIHLKTKVVSATWNKSMKKYHVVTNTGREMYVNVLISGAGLVREPVVPDFPGKQSFEGRSFHSAKWPRDVDFTNKRLAVIGTGASAVQIVPRMAKKVKDLFVFQRNACWSPPRGNMRMHPFWVNFHRYIPGTLTAHRVIIFWCMELVYLLSLRKSMPGKQFYADMIKKYVRYVVKDPETAEKLIPKYTLGEKRTTWSDSYLQAYNNPNVHLITDKIDKITESGIETVTKDLHEVDYICYATGFSPMASLVDAFEIRNGDGLRFKDVVEKDPKAYLGITFKGFDNFFLLEGPNTYLPSNSVLWMIECQVNYVGDCLSKMVRNNITAVSVKESSLDRFMDLVDRYMKNCVFGTEGVVSWYKEMDASQRNFVLWPSHLPHYWWITKTASLDDYACY